MSMTLAAADTYISRIIGGAGATNIISEARDALKATFNELLHRNNWSWLGVDTAQTFTVASGSTNTNTTITTAVTDGFKNVLVGMTVADDGSDIPAGTKVASIESNTSLTLDTAAIGTTADTVVFTFGGTIPIIDGTADYNLPAPFWKPLSCRLVSTQFRPLRFIRIQDWDNMSYQQTTEGTVVAYTIWDGSTFDPNSTQQSKIKFIRVPGADDVALLRYWRKPDFTGTYVDVPDEYLYVFLDFARVHLLRVKDAANERLPMLTRDIEQRLARAVSADREEGGDDQFDRFRTPAEMDSAGIFDGNFFPRGDVIWRAGY
jgi:hypothetical protein